MAASVEFHLLGLWLQEAKCFKCMQDLFFSGAVRHVDTEMTAMKEDICNSHRSLETGSRHSMQGHTRKHQGHSGGRRREGNIWARVFIVVSGVRNGQAGSAGFGLAGVNDCSRLWGMELSLVVWALFLG